MIEERGVIAPASSPVMWSSSPVMSEFYSATAVNLRAPSRLPRKSARCSRPQSRESMSEGLDHILRRTDRRFHKPLRQPHDSLKAHRAAILALGEHRPAVGRVDDLNNNW